MQLFSEAVFLQDKKAGSLSQTTDAKRAKGQWAVQAAGCDSESQVHLRYFRLSQGLKSTESIAFSQVNSKHFYSS